MNTLDYWHPYITDEQEIYSCDMLRIKMYMGKNIERVNKYFEQQSAYNFAYDIKVHKSYSSFSYRNMLNIKLHSDKTSFVVMYGFNGIKEKDGDLIIEFNPNKLSRNPWFIDIWTELKQNAYSIEIIRYDLAIDLPLDRQYVSMPKQGNSRYSTVKTDSLTESLGVHNNSGFIKVYDKSKESKLSYPCTRIEITLGRDDLASDFIPNIYVKDYQIAFKEDNDLSQNDKVFLRLLEDINNPDFYLNQLTYRKREKLNKYMSRKKFILNKMASHEIRYAVLNIEKEGII